MRTFSAGVTSTPKLQKVQLTEDEDKTHWVGDLNATIQQSYNELVQFKGLENLKLSEYPELKDSWHSDLPVELFSGLASLVVDDCPFFSHAISPALLPVLKDLEQLEVENCHSLEGLLDLEKLNIDEESSKLLPRLRELWLTDLPMLERLWSKDCQAIFKLKNLCVLKVDNCSSLRNTFNQSVAEGFEKLKTIEIRNCAVMEAILTADSEEEISVGKIVIPALESLVLCSLPNLTSVYSGSGILELPSLKEIAIDCCPKMKAFVSSTLRVKQPRVVDEETEETLFEGDAHDSAALLFDDKVGLSELEELRIVNMDGLKKIWDDKLHEGSFAKLKTLKVEHAVQLQNVFPSKIESVFQNLENVLITDCCSLTKLFDTSSIVVSQLKTLRIQRLPKLEFLFLASIARGPLRLEELEVNECGIEEIVTKGDAVELEEVPVFRFPELTYLQLWRLQKLKGFYSGRHISEWPMLTSLVVNHYIKTAIFDWESWTHQSQEACSESQVATSIPQSLLPVNAVIPNLKELTLNAKDVAMICNGQVPIDLFCGINFLRLSFFEGESTGFLIAFLERYFSHLEALYLLPSSSEEMFFQDGHIGEENQGTVFLQLRCLRLVLFHNLKQFWKQNSRPDHLLKNLGTLEVWQCHDLTNLALLSSSFHSLTTLDVSECNGLLNLFSSSMAKSLEQLANLSIRECTMVTEIVANEGDGAEEEIIFSNLETLELHCLPSLTSFCSENYSFKFPSLVKVVVRQCPKMRTFSRGDLSILKLQNVQFTKDGDEDCWEGDLNATILKLHKGQAVEQSSQLDSETNQAETDDAFSSIEVAATEMNLELEAKSIAEITTEEQDAVLEITQLDSRYQVSDAPSNDKVVKSASATKNLLTQQSSNSDSSQEDPTSTQSSSTPKNRESDIPMQLPEDDRSAPSSEHPQQEDVSAILIQQSKTILELSPTAAEHTPMMLPKTLDEADEAVPPEELPFSSKQPSSNFETADAEKKYIENPGISEDLHQEIEANSEVIIEEKARQDNMTRPETAQYDSADKEEAKTTNTQLGPSYLSHQPTLSDTEQLECHEQEDVITTQNMETGVALEAQKDPQPIADCETPAQQGRMLSVERATGEKSEHQSNINQPVIKSASATKNLLTQQSSICDERTVALTATAEPSLTIGTQVSGEEVIEADLSIDSEAEAPPHDGAAVESKPINSPGQSSSDFATTRADHNETLTLSRGLGSEDLSSLEHPWFASMQKSEPLMDWLNSKSETRETGPTKADLEEAVKTIEDCLSHTVEELNERRAYDSIEAALEILAAPSTPKHLVAILKVTARMIAICKEKLPKAQSVMKAHQTSLDKYSTKHSTLSNGIEKQKAAMAGLRGEVNSLIAEDQDVSKKIEELLAKQGRIRRGLAIATKELEQMSNETESLIREDESAEREMKEVEDEYLDASRLIGEAEGTSLRVRRVLDQVKSFYNL